MSKPVAEFSESSRVLFELSHGKTGKDGESKVQSGQKGPTSFFYAMKRLLTTEQIRSEHGEACSLRRKTITTGSSKDHSPQEHYKAREKANRTFLEAKGKDPKEEAHQFWLKSAKQSMGGLATDQTVEATLTRVEPELRALRPWYDLAHMEGAACQAMAEGHGLKEVRCTAFADVHILIKTLSEKGPLMVTGCFGSPFYVEQEASRLSFKVGEHPLYGWEQEPPIAGGLDFLIHAVVIVGAEVKENKEYVYWVNPKDANIPAEGQRVYCSTFSTMWTQLTTFIGNPLFCVPSQAHEFTTGAFYNPAFSSEEANISAFLSAGEPLPLCATCSQVQSTEPRFNHDGTVASTTEKLSICAQCHIARYCSTKCQKKHWKAHKKVCVERDINPSVVDRIVKRACHGKCGEGVLRLDSRNFDSKYTFEPSSKPSEEVEKGKLYVDVEVDGRKIGRYTYHVSVLLGETSPEQSQLFEAFRGASSEVNELSEAIKDIADGLYEKAFQDIFGRGTSSPPTDEMNTFFVPAAQVLTQMMISRGCSSDEIVRLAQEYKLSDPCLQMIGMNFIKAHNNAAAHAIAGLMSEGCRQEFIPIIEMGPPSTEL